MKPSRLTEGLNKTAKYTSIAEYQTMYAQMNGTSGLLRKFNIGTTSSILALQMNNTEWDPFLGAALKRNKRNYMNIGL